MKHFYNFIITNVSLQILNTDIFLGNKNNFSALSTSDDSWVSSPTSLWCLINTPLDNIQLLENSPDLSVQMNISQVKVSGNMFPEGILHPGIIAQADPRAFIFNFWKWLAVWRSHFYKHFV